MNLKKEMALALAGILLLGTMTGCGKGEETEKPKTEKPGKTEAVEEVSSKLAYVPTYYDLLTEDGKGFQYVQSFQLSGDQLYLYGGYETGEVEKPTDENGEPILDDDGEPLEYPITEDALFRMDIQGGKAQRMELEQPELPEGMEGDSYIRNMSAAGDGTLWIQQEVNTYSFDFPADVAEGVDPDDPNTWPEGFEPYEYYVPGDNYSVLVHFDAAGQPLGQIRLEMPDDTYVNNLFFDSQGNIYAYDWENLLIFDPTGKLAETIPMTDHGELCQVSPDELGMVTYSTEKQSQVLKLLNLETKKFDKEIKLPMSAWQVFPGNEDYDLLYKVNDSIYGYVTETEAAEKIFSWLDCDVDSSYVEDFQFLPDGRIVTVERQDHRDPESKTKLLVLNPVDASTIPQKQELVLGTFYLDQEIRANVIKFNRSHDDVRIRVRDYGEMAGDGGYEDAMQKMNTEILSGKGPDMICAQGMPVDRYAAKGLLVDLWPLIDSDPELGRDQLMEHFFDALSDDGKLYAISNGFAIQTAACKKSIVGDRQSWTLAEMQEAMKGLQPGATVLHEMTTKSEMLSNAISFDMGSYVDWETGTCYFDTPEFISVLNFANTFAPDLDPEDLQNVDWENMESEYSRLQSGKQLMTSCYISDFDTVQTQNAFHGGEVAFIGYPTESGSGSTFQPQAMLSIAASCPDQQLAWSFARELLLEKNQKMNMGWSFPTNKNAFDAMAKDAMTPRYEINPETGEKEEVSKGGIGFDNDFSIEIYACKQEEYDALMELYNNTDSVSSYNQEIMSLITEEAKPFFAGQKTAEETAKLIQGRVGLYIMEQG